jgi:hypothetical protein
VHPSPLIIGFTVLLVVACSGPMPIAKSSAVPHAPETVPMALRTSDQLAAAIAGRLNVQDDCVVIRAGSSTFVVVWPSPGTSWDASNAVVSLDGVAARVGENVVLDGGEYPFPPLDPRTVRWVSPPTEGCLRIPKAWAASGMHSKQDDEGTAATPTLGPETPPSGG